MELEAYGWDAAFAEALDALERPELIPGRIAHAASGFYRTLTADGELRAVAAGRLRHAAGSGAALPTIGDWVALERPPTGDARIEHVLPRRSKLSRKVPGRRSAEQVVAANIDAVVIVIGLDGDYSPRRTERMLASAWESGGRPIVVLSKADLCEQTEARTAEIGEIAPGVPVLAMNCHDSDDVAPLRAQLGPRETAVLLGSSGVGKSTLINSLLGRDAQRTGAVREGDDRGKHTTTHRELFRLPGGGLLIDNPGIRELQLWTGEESLEQTFDDIGELAERCRYRDCGHEREPGCAVRAAVEAGELEASRLESFHGLRAELRYLELRQSDSLRRVERQKWRTIHKSMRNFDKSGGGGSKR